MITLLVALSGQHALAADPSRPHPHQGVIAKIAGKPTVPTLTAEDLEKLGQGEPVMKQEKMSGASGRGIAVQDIHAPSETVWSRILDYKSYPLMVDNVKECETYATEGDLIRTRFLIGAMLMNIEYYIEHTYKPDNGYLTWTLDYARDSDLDDSVGYWVAAPVDGKDGWTRVFYSVEVKLRGWVPAAIEGMIAKQGLPKATAWVKRESEKAAGTSAE